MVYFEVLIAYIALLCLLGLDAFVLAPRVVLLLMSLLLEQHVYKFFDAPLDKIFKKETGQAITTTLCGVMAHGSALSLAGQRFEAWPSHTEDLKKRYVLLLCFTLSI